MIIWLAILVATAAEPVFVVPPVPFAPVLATPAFAPIQPTELVFCFSPEVKLKFGRQTRVELYPAAKRMPADWTDTAPADPVGFNRGGAQPID